MSSLGDYGYVYLNLVLVILGLIITLFVVRRFKFKKYFNHNAMKVINALQIGSKEKLILVEVNKTQILVGATPTHIETLHIFNPMQEEESISGLAYAKDFSDTLMDVNK